VNTDRQNQSPYSPWIQKLVGLVVFVLNMSLLVGLGLKFRRQYEWLAGFHVEGLCLMVLIGLGLAGVSAPFFASSVSARPEDRPKTVLEAFKLYLSVTMITFCALSVVFVALWIVGWILEFVRYGLMVFKHWLIGPA
jgi:hypothetical protein